MKYHKWTYLVVLSVAMAAVLTACGERVDKFDRSAKTELTEEEQISHMLNDAMYRLSYGDKSGLYNLEFSYERYQTNFDQYLGSGMIGWANADGWDSIVVDSIQFFRPESAFVYTRVYFGDRIPPNDEYEERLTIYDDNGRWIKPTVSTYLKQQEYEEIFRQADSAAAAEAEAEG